MRYTINFDSSRDIQAPVPDMSVDLAAAIESGVVLDTGMIVEHNDIDNPSSVLGRVRDVFDAFEAQKKILNAGKIQTSAPTVSTEAKSES